MSDNTALIQDLVGSIGQEGWSTKFNDALADDLVWVATGSSPVAGTIETIYAKRHHPLSDALGAKAISLLVEHLKPSIETSTAEQLAHRGECQFAAWFSIFGSMNTRFEISHLLGHQIGPRWNIAHGITSCITLPHAMRFMAGIAPERFGPIAEGFGIPFDRANPKASALACADRTAPQLEPTQKSVFGSRKCREYFLD